MAAAALSPALSSPRLSLSFPSLFHHQNLIFLSPSPISSSSSSSYSYSYCYSSCLRSRQAKQPLHLEPIKHRRSWKALQASPNEESSVSVSSERWLLEPVGDGDSRHIGYKVPLPGAFEIASDVATIGRLPQKADLVIPVATVSGLHARLEKKNGSLLVTDLNSTNGTFVDEKKLKPGVLTTVSPGSCITFGDTNLAIFRVSKLEKVDATSKETEGSEIISEAEVLNEI